jgi:serine/threonine protein phosphatase PrpC
MMIRGRVLGVLAVARSLGDHGLKDFVIGRPFLSSTTVEIAKNSFEGTNENKVGGWDKKSALTDGEFLIAACDGLWDVMEDQEAVDMVRKFVVEDTREKEVARYLVDEALRRGSTDNITVVVYWL